MISRLIHVNSGRVWNIQLNTSQDADMQKAKNVANYMLKKIMYVCATTSINIFPVRKVSDGVYSVSFQIRPDRDITVSKMNQAIKNAKDPNSKDKDRPDLSKCTLSVEDGKLMITFKQGNSKTKRK